MNEFTDSERASFYKAVFSRRDVRSNFISKEINDDTLVRILNAAHHAPSVGFSQPWNFILIKDKDTKHKVKESFDKTRLQAAELLEEPKKSDYLKLKLEGILESPINICVTYDETKFGPFVIGRSSIPQTGVYSVCCAIQNLWLAARTEGLGLGWVSILDNDNLKNILNIPKHILPVAYLCLGFVKEFATKPDLQTAKWLPRLDLQDVIYYEKWSNQQDSKWDTTLQKVVKLKD